jgi:hypothetical protein
MQPTTRQKMAKPIPTTKPTRKPKNNTKHQRGDKNGLKLTGPLTFTLWRLSRIDAAECAVEERFGKCRVLV